MEEQTNGSTQRSAREDFGRILEWLGRQPRELGLAVDESRDEYPRFSDRDLVTSAQVLVGGFVAALALALVAAALPLWMTVLIAAGVAVGVYFLRRRYQPLPLADAYVAEGRYFADDRDGVPLGTCSGASVKDLADELAPAAEEQAELDHGDVPAAPLVEAIHRAIDESGRRFPVLVEHPVNGGGHIRFSVERGDC